VFGVFKSAELADKFIADNGSSFSLDIIKAQTNNWVLLETNETSVDKTEFIGADNDMINNMVAQSVKDADISK